MEAAPGLCFHGEDQANLASQDMGACLGEASSTAHQEDMQLLLELTLK